MIVRILNQKTNSDRFFDCRSSCLNTTSEKPTLILEFAIEKPIEVMLSSRDEIYYMNNSGKTVHADYIMLNR